MKNEEIIDKLNAVGEINAVSPKEIEEALHKAREEELNQCLACRLPLQSYNHLDTLLCRHIRPYDTVN